MAIRTVPQIAQRRAGFTLVELLLVTVLLLLMLGGVIFSFSNLRKNATLDEGASQIEALFRYARAQAASSGRLVRIAFEEEVGDGLEVPLGNLRVEWESDPLNAPGLFSELPDAAGLIRSITELVRVEFVKAIEFDPEVADPHAAAADVGAESGGATNESVWITFPPIAFFPDGSSDSSELTIASREEEDGRRVILNLAGLTGMVRRTMRAAEATFTEASDSADKKPEAEISKPVSTEKTGHSPAPKLDVDHKMK